MASRRGLCDGAGHDLIRRRAGLRAGRGRVLLGDRRRGGGQGVGGPPCQAWRDLAVARQLVEGLSEACRCLEAM